MSDVNFEVAATGEGLIRFLDYAIEKGHLKTATGQAMKTAVKEVLSSTEGEDKWESVDVDSLDVDDIQRRFETLRAMKFSRSSLGTYKSRFRKSLDMFNEFPREPVDVAPVGEASQSQVQGQAGAGRTAHAAVVRRAEQGRRHLGVAPVVAPLLDHHLPVPHP